MPLRDRWARRVDLRDLGRHPREVGDPDGVLHHLVAALVVGVGPQPLREAAAGVEVGDVGVARLGVAGLVAGPVGLQAGLVLHHARARTPRRRGRAGSRTGTHQRCGRAWRPTGPPTTSLIERANGSVRVGATTSSGRASGPAPLMGSCRWGPPGRTGRRRCRRRCPAVAAAVPGLARRSLRGWRRRGRWSASACCCSSAWACWSASAAGCTARARRRAPPRRRTPPPGSPRTRHRRAPRPSGRSTCGSGSRRRSSWACSR